MVNEVPDKMEFDDVPVANLLRNLKRVDAPRDFDHRVRAKIAQGRPKADRGWVIPVWAKAGVTAALILGLASYIGFNSIPTGPSTTATVTEAPPSVQTLRPVAAEPATPAAPLETRPEVASIQPTSTPARPATVRRQNPKRTAAGGGSVDFAVRIGKTVEVSDLPVTDVLSRAGAKVSFEGNSMKVDDATGSAVRSGLKPGDVIESIDGKSVDAKSTLKRTAAGRNLRVRRDGKILDIVIKN
jgi:hypothetical protein